MNRTEDLGRFPRIKLRISNLSANDGIPAVWLEVTGNDRHWVGGVYDLLRGEVAKNLPPWNVMRSGWAVLFFSLLLAAAASGGVLQVLSKAGNPDLSGMIVLGSLTLLLGTLFFSIFVMSLLHRLFPSFEVLEAATSSHARQTRAILVTTIALALSVAGVVLGVMAV